ncbi:S8 family serine peptidase [Haloarchaeobius sp. HRN-SO-5]|uniref:S8 family serine peptidase n=1 Tax=Haloarchaeobius sp. HRN-SO-5 TaxID=3446118 RepID=UPI003EBC6455
MTENTNHLSRRSMLSGVSSGLVAATVVGTASADDVGDYVVGVSSDHGLATARERATSVRHEFDFGQIGKAVAGRFPEAAIDGLRNNPHVRYVEADSEYYALAETLPWGVDRVDADVLHGNGDTGSGVDIAILDTGIDSDHPDLQANVQGGKCFAADCCGEASGGGGPFGCNTNDNTCNHAWDDDNDHGTHCAGIANAVDNTEGVVGVSTEANLWAGKVLDGCGSGSLSSVAAGIEWAADQGFDVASMSLGASSGDQTLKDACTYAANKGVLLVAAAGNDGECTDCVGYPAAYSEVVAVSSTDSDDSLSSFSSTGPEVELAAPGGEIYSTVPGGYDTFSGTSMACPHVSGAGAQVMAQGATASEARTALQDSAEDIGLASNEQGYGLLDAEAAVAAVDGGGGSDDTTAPTAPSNLSSPAHTDTSVDLDWDASSDDGTGVDHYNVYVDGTKTTESTDTTATVSGLSSNTAYDFYVTAVDGAGNESSASNTITVTTDESTSSAPTIDSYTVTEAGSPNPHAEITADWTVSDADGDLSSVEVVVEETGDSSTTAVSGSTASGSDSFKIKQGGGTTYTVTLTVTDGAGNATSSSQTVSA